MLNKVFNLSRKQVEDSLVTPEEFVNLDVNKKIDELYKATYINIKLALSIRRNQKKPKRVEIPEGKTYETGLES